MTAKWVKVSKYCAETGDTPGGVRAKRRSGLWQEGVQWKKAPDGNVWINVEAVQQWIEAKPAGKRQLAA